MTDTPTLYRINDDKAMEFEPGLEDLFVKLIHEGVLVPVEPAFYVEVHMTNGFAGTFPKIKESEFIGVDVDNEMMVDLEVGRYAIVAVSDETPADKVARIGLEQEAMEQSDGA